ncbi:hypothetical protein C0Q16_28890, partial [Klebsiella pneumoniae]
LFWRISERLKSATITEESSQRCAPLEMAPKGVKGPEVRLRRHQVSVGKERISTKGNAGVLQRTVEQDNRG